MKRMRKTDVYEKEDEETLTVETLVRKSINQILVQETVDAYMLNLVQAIYNVTIEENCLLSCLTYKPTIYATKT